MNFKPGDTVRFLNETGGGVVRKIINNFMVSVAIEDGFEIPTLVSNLVLVEKKGVNESLFAREFNVPAMPEIRPEPAAEPGLDDESETFNTSYGQSATVSEGVYLAFVPVNQEWLVSGNIGIYLVNHTSHHILYSFFLRNDKSYSGMDYGSLSKNSNVLIESILREDIEMWSKGLIQVLFHNDEPEKVYSPVSEQFHVKPIKFYHESGFREFLLLAKRKSLVVPICEMNSVPTTDEQQHSQDATGVPAVPVKQTMHKPKAGIDDFRTSPGEAEVDLHISKLTDQFDNMNPHEILLMQMRYFGQMLENAMANHYVKVIFIHGIGNGTLKAKIIEYLRNYENVELKNAPFAKYGNGAVELILQENI
jgi:hypothetical protein